MVTSYDVLVKRYEPKDPRLGRHVRHDSRSLSYQVQAKDINTLSSVKHERHIPVLDQGQLGSCTGNASVGCLATGKFWDSQAVQQMLSPTDSNANEQVAVGVYSEATSLDPYEGMYPPTDTGSDGLSVAQVLQKRGLISGYQHATSLEAILTALAEQPVIVGTEWRQDMFNSAPDGRLKITGSVAGGHEYLLDELDVENKLVWMCNSWGPRWAVNGRAYFTWEDFDNLRAAQGDCTVFVPVTEPAPEPAPAPTLDVRTELALIARKQKRLSNRINELIPLIG